MAAANIIMYINLCNSTEPAVNKLTIFILNNPISPQLIAPIITNKKDILSKRLILHIIYPPK